MRKKSIAATVAALALIGAPAAIANGDGRVDRAEGGNGSIVVIDGVDRYDTAAQVALRSGDGPSTEVLYIVNGERPIDALGVGVVTGNSRLLLVKRDTIPNATEKALKQISHARLVFVGGEEAISADVRRKVAEMSCNYVAAGREGC